jgi:hypothetical protein
MRMSMGASGIGRGRPARGARLRGMLADVRLRVGRNLESDQQHENGECRPQAKN